ncbi:uncharacterized protein LOC127263318 [Andrographis paniculata]|uniref:uncharacterized protein LOC127263318 n=1 Tax=Andrographis paniculata TaxID=175694 RepID=UPI0021E7B644|nr:uncharacterized protein LOC127263318 [Andrographis paniculata]
MADVEPRKRSRDESAESELGIDSPEVKRLRENLLETLEDDEAEFCTGSQDLDSLLKSFEEEISPSPRGGGDSVQAVDPATESADSRPDLGYLLEASDDELGLPPTSGELRNDLERVESDSSGLGSEYWEIPDYDSFGFGFGVTETETVTNGGNGEYVALDGLFDHSDMGFGSGGGVGPRPETLPA